MNRSFVLYSGLSLLAILSPVTAYAAKPDEVAADKPEIVVEGTKEQRKIVHQYIADAVDEGRNDQYTRFSAPVCPSAIGFTKPVEVFIEQRIREVATAAEIRTAAPDCDVNLHLMIVENGPEAISELRRKHSRAFGRMTPYERQRLAGRKGPAYDWHVIKEISVDDGSNRASGVSSYAGGAAYDFLASEIFNAGRSNVKSLILLPVRQEISHAFVLIEREAIIGLSPVQIADFAAVRALMRVKDGASEHVRASSILGIFNHSAPYDDAPEIIDELDFAVLKSLYSAPSDQSAARQRSIMARAANKELIKGQ